MTADTATAHSLITIFASLANDTVGLAAGEGAVWVAAREEQAVKRIDPATNKVVATIAGIGTHVNTLFVGAGAVWVPSGGDGTIARIDPQTNQIVATIKVCAGSTLQIFGADIGMAFGADTVWVGCPEGLYRMDPQTNEVMAPVPGIIDVGAMTFSHGLLWVGHYDLPSIEQLDPQTNQVVGTPFDIGSRQRVVVPSEDAIWVPSEVMGTVTRIDPRTKQVVATIPVGAQPYGLAVGPADVWVVNMGDHTIAHIDPATNQVTATSSPIGTEIVNIAFYGDALWVSDHLAGVVYRIDPQHLP